MRPKISASACRRRAFRPSGGSFSRMGLALRSMWAAANPFEPPTCWTWAPPFWQHAPMLATSPKPLHPVNVALRMAIGASWGLFCLLPTLSIALLLLPWRGLRVRLGNLYARVAVLPFVRIMGFDWHVDHPERLGGQQAIYLCNHSSSLDLFLGSGLCPMGGCGTAKKEVIYVPAIGQAFWLTGHIRLDRGNTEKAKASMRELASVVGRHALSVWVWPEGTRSRDGRLLPFKKGFVHMAVATGLPIVPVVFVGVHKHWPAKGYRLVPGTIEVKVLPAISTKGWTVDTAEAHIAELRAVYAAALPEDQRTIGVEPVVEVSEAGA